MRGKSDATIRRYITGGYTLVEMAVVISIVAVITAGSLVLGNLRLGKEKMGSTEERMAILERSLLAYINLNHRLPCPAQGNLTESSSNFGKEADNPGSCTGGTIAASFNDGGQIVGGVLPVVTLGLPADMMYDAWGKRITYAVDKRYTDIRNTTYKLPLPFLMNGHASSCGGVTIKDNADNTLVNNAVYTLISHGEDGHGAFKRDGTRVNDLNVNTSTQDNASYDAGYATSFDAQFRSHNYTENANDAKDVFNDIVRYKTRRDIRLFSDEAAINLANSSVVAPEGWLYVPEATLPDGSVVPAFHVMKYEASDADNDKIPSSVPGATPWIDPDYTTARQACQNLAFNHDITNASQRTVTGKGVSMEYDIISESQWLAIAHLLVQDSRNWVDGCYAQNGTYKGHSDDVPFSALAAGSDDTDGYTGTGNSASGATVNERAQRRTLYLPSGQAIWDFSGNLREWSYCDFGYCIADNNDNPNPLGQTEAPYYTNGQLSIAGWYEYYTNLVADGTMDALMPPSGWNNTQNMGRIRVANSNIFNGILRGGTYWTSAGAGIFQTRVGQSTVSDTGFRCVHNINGTLTSKTRDTTLFSPNNLEGLEIWYDATDLDADDLVEGTGEGVSGQNDLTSGADCIEDGYWQHDGCIRAWYNKAQDKYHAVSKRFNGALYDPGNDWNRPTYKVSGINGQPSVNFLSGEPEWFDTYHGLTINRIAGDSSQDNGAGFVFDGMTQFTLFAVASGSNLDSIIVGEDDDTTGAPHFLPHPQFLLFPYNIGNIRMDPSNCPPEPSWRCADDGDYVLMMDNLMGGDDAGNQYCRYLGVTNTDTGYPCTEDSDTVNAINFACAKLGGIASPENGLTHGTPHIVSATFKAGENMGLRGYVDGGSPDIADSAVTTSSEALEHANASCGNSGVAVDTIDLKLIIGRRRYAGNYLDADVGEILIYNRALSNKERIMVEKYLASKWRTKYLGPEGQ